MSITSAIDRTDQPPPVRSGPDRASVRVITRSPVAFASSAQTDGTIRPLRAVGSIESGGAGPLTPVAFSSAIVGVKVAASIGLIGPSSASEAAQRSSRQTACGPNSGSASIR